MQKIYHKLLAFTKKIFGPRHLHKDIDSSASFAHEKIIQDLKALQAKYSWQSDLSFFTYNPSEHVINSIAANKVAGLIQKIEKPTTFNR